MDAGGAANDPPLPAQQTWPFARRRFFMGFYVVGIALTVTGTAFVVVTHDDWGDLLLAPLFGIQSVLFCVQAWSIARTELRADLEGLHSLAGRRRETYPWETISEIRPSILKGRRTYLVAVRDGLPTVDLPVTEEHLDELRRWHHAATDTVR